MRKASLMWFGGVLAVGVVEACDGAGGGGATFTTSVPGNTPLGGLSGGQLDTLCADGKKFASQAEVKADTCRVGGFLAVLFSASFMPDATDAELRTICAQAYAGCVSPDPDAGAGAGAGDSGMCKPAPPSCTATVAEYAACLNDSTAQQHALAQTVPDCASITRANLTATDGGASPALPEQPASCVSVGLKCSGVSDEARAFADQYCALIQPCCTQASMGSTCATNVTSAAQAGTYDATAGAACLAAVRARAAAPGFCAGLGVIQTGASIGWAAVDPACAAVFQARGIKAPGAACDNDDECASGPNGGALCVFNIFTGGGGQDGSPSQVCEQTTGKASDGPCIGTVVVDFGISGTADPPPQGMFCDQARGVVCDDATHLCVPAHQLGDVCSSVTECDNVTTYCDFHTCKARLPIGATCDGSLLAECDGTTYCDDTTHRCTALGAAGAACTTSTFVSGCLSGFCNNGSCTDPLAPVCR